MHILFLNGNEFRGTWRDFIRALWHPSFIGLVLAMTGSLFLIRPYDHFLPNGVISHILIVASSVVVFFCVALFGFSRFSRANRRARSHAVILPAMAITTVWGVAISVLAGGSALSPLGWAELIAFNFVFAVFAEIFLASFLLRRIMAETGLQTHPMVGISPSLLQKQQDKSGPTATKTAIHAVDEGTATQNLEILGKTVACDAVWHLKAEEHYVSLTLHDGASYLLRGRLADAIAQVPAEVGLQVHRSHWVARSALAELERKRDGWRLRLRNGTDIPVARNRQAEVRDWVEKALKPA